MTGTEIAVGYLFAWAVRKAKRVAGRADAEVDRTLDAAMDRLHDLVSRKLGEDPALRRLAEEAAAGQEKPTDRTRQRVQLALEEAAEQDSGFAEGLNALARAVEELQALPRSAGGVVTELEALNDWQRRLKEEEQRRTEAKANANRPHKLSENLQHQIRKFLASDLPIPDFVGGHIGWVVYWDPSDSDGPPFPELLLTRDGSLLASDVMGATWRPVWNSWVDGPHHYFGDYETEEIGFDRLVIMGLAEVLNEGDQRRPYREHIGTPRRELLAVLVLIAGAVGAPAVMAIGYVIALSSLRIGTIRAKALAVFGPLVLAPAILIGAREVGLVSPADFRWGWGYMPLACGLLTSTYILYRIYRIYLSLIRPSG